MMLCFAKSPLKLLHMLNKLYYFSSAWDLKANTYKKVIEFSERQEKTDAHIYNNEEISTMCMTRNGWLNTDIALLNQILTGYFKTCL